ncbi:MAG: serine hydrolase [Miniphocaeibacter sp.]|uniref:D-alanyl-D-alanine carboxypeptidase family protein n=1 Tax=Miniphocaeibacter sp. TaxID=3100973 RepID=UPI001817F10F|nr:D-alanyl-D-alanine carboxypeptidase [Gallicola sp.]
MKKNRKILLIIGIFLIVITALILVYFGIFKNNKFKDLTFESKNIYVYNITDEKEVLNINGEEKVAPASLTKIMTVIASLENIDDLSALAPVDKASYQEMVAVNSSMAGFYGKEQTTYRDLLYGTMLASGGECANSLAINISKTTEEFVKLMNEKSKEIGLNNTNFTNPEGLDEENNYSTAKDISELIKNSLKNSEFREIFTKEEYISTSTLDHPEGIEIKSTVLTALSDYEQKDFKIIGGKSGTTENAGFCWATIAEKNNKEYICVVMGSETNEGRIEDTLKIMDEI